MDELLDFSGKVALVTGATSGLGVRFAKVLASAGAKVAIAGRREDRLETVKAEIEAGHVIDLALNDEGADEQEDGDDKLGDDQGFANGAGAFAGGSFEC